VLIRFSCEPIIVAWIPTENAERRVLCSCLVLQEGLSVDDVILMFGMLVLFSSFMGTVALARFIVSTVSAEAGCMATSNAQPTCVCMNSVMSRCSTPTVTVFSDRACTCMCSWQCERLCICIFKLPGL